MVQTAAVEAYRVIRAFQWDGWKFAPGGKCRCTCSLDPELSCPGLVGEGCICGKISCNCDCGIDPKQYGGDIWFVAPGHSRKQSQLDQRFAVYDASLPAVAELLAKEEYRRLLKPWSKGLEYAPRRAKG